MDKFMEKIKKFFSNKLYLGLTIGAAVLLVAGIVLAVVLTGNSGNTNTPVATLTDCKVEVKSEGGKALENVGVYVYKDAAKTDMLTYVKTDANGIAAIDVDVVAGSVAVLDKLPAGYVAEESYPITQAETKITLKTQFLSEMTQVKLGDVMFDFTATAVDGTEYTLSKLLEQKKAVVLNFWYVNCDPCKAEFPYLEQAYQTYGDDVAVLALNPEGDKAAAIETFAKENNLTFPVFEADSAFKNAFGIQAYPMTVIIDRFGAIGLIHTGGIDSAKTFEDAFAYFTAEDYVQSTVSDIKSLEKEEEEIEADGSAENPFTFDGVTEFEVTVPAGGEVYCVVYKVSGLQLKIEDAAARLIYDNNAYHPEEGVIAVTIADQGPFNPAKLTIGNTSEEEKTFKVTFKDVPGSMNDPLPLLFGDMTVNVAEGNSQGVYYLLESAEDGILSLKCVTAPEGIEYNFTLDNLTTSQQVSFLDGEEDVIEMEVKAGEQVRVCISTFPNSENVYPAAEFKFNVAFGDGEQEETQKPTEQEQKPTDPTPTEPTPDDKPDTNGKLMNADAPIDQYGFNDFSIEVGKGEKYLVNMMRIFNEATLCISDKDAYVVYKGTTYTPDASGNIYIRIKGQGTFTPTKLEIGNSGSAKKTFNVKFYFDKGTRENPGELKTGTNVIECKKGNDQGTFYTFKANKAGTLTITLKGIDPSKYEAKISISDMQAEPTVVDLEEGQNTLTIDLPAGATAEIIFSVIDPNKEWNIPAADITIDVAFN